MAHPKDSGVGGFIEAAGAGGGSLPLGSSAFLVTEELASLIRQPAETVRYWRHIGKGPRSFKVGRRVLYAREDVEAWLRDARDAG